MKICISGAGAIGGYLGVQLVRADEQCIEGARKVGAHKTYMLPDLELGRPTEIDSMVQTPALDAVLALVAQRARIAALYDGAFRAADRNALAVG